MREKFEEELTAIKNNMKKMGDMCKSSISIAIEYMLDDGEERLNKVKEIEAGINKMESTIVSQCMVVFMREQPVAGDLRMVSSALRIISDMERIGDHALDVTEVARNLDRKRLPDMSVLKTMADSSLLMVTDVVKAFVDGDVELANAVIKYDDVVDGDFFRIKKKISEEISENIETADQGLDLLMISKYLERVSDHAVNIAEWVKFSVTGERY